MGYDPQMNDNLQNFWDAHAFSDHMRLTSANPLVLNHCGDVKGMLILELGCGTGTLSRALSSMGATVTAVDFSQQMIESAKMTEGPEVEYLCRDVTKLDLGRKFDLIVGSFFLHEIRAGDYSVLVQRLAEHLMPTGRIIFVENSFFNPVFRFVRTRLVDRGHLRKVGSLDETPFDAVRFKMMADTFPVCVRRVDKFVLFSKATGQFLSHHTGLGWTWHLGAQLDRWFDRMEATNRLKLAWSYQQTIIASR